MRKTLILFIFIVNICVGFLSGCIDEKLSTTNENLGIAFKNIDTHFYNYDYEYSWSILMNYATFTLSMLDGMKNYEDLIGEEITYVEDTIQNYQNSGDSSSDIDEKINLYNSKKNTIKTSLNNMITYRYFINMTRNKMILLENYVSKNDLMNLKVQSEDYEEAVIYLDEMVDILIKLKNNEYNRSELGIGTYTEEIFSVYDLYQEAWSIYRQYLLTEDETEANDLYQEYSEKYDEAYAIESNENLTEANEEVDGWYQENIAVCIDIFVGYE